MMTMAMMNDVVFLVHLVSCWRGVCIYVSSYLAWLFTLLCCCWL